MNEVPDEDGDGTVDLTSTESLKRTQDRMLREQKERVAFWQAVLANKIGRREIWRLVADPQWGHAFERPFAVGPNGFPQPEATWFQAGAKDFGMRFYHELMRIDPDGTLAMLKEHEPSFQKSRRQKTGGED